MYENLGLFRVPGQCNQGNQLDHVSYRSTTTSHTQHQSDVRGTIPQSHDVSRLLNDNNNAGSGHDSSIKPYSTAHLLSFRYRNSDSVPTTGTISVTAPETAEDNERHSACVTPPQSDSSMTSLTSISPASSTTSDSETPPLRSTSSSPNSECGSVTSPETDSKPAKKKARTAYTAQQIKALEKIFFENPYPDSEHFETISKDLGVPESNIKIWFQNKRARWRRRANDTRNNNILQQQTPATLPMTSHFTPYGYMTYPSPLMTSCVPSAAATSSMMSPYGYPAMTSQYVPGYNPWMPQTMSSNQMSWLPDNRGNVYNASYATSQRAPASQNNVMSHTNELSTRSHPPIASQRALNLNHMSNFTH